MAHRALRIVHSCDPPKQEILYRYKRAQYTPKSDSDPYRPTPARVPRRHGGSVACGTIETLRCQKPNCAACAATANQHIAHNPKAVLDTYSDYVGRKLGPCYIATFDEMCPGNRMVLDWIDNVSFNLEPVLEDTRSSPTLSSSNDMPGTPTSQFDPSFATFPRPMARGDQDLMEWGMEWAMPTWSGASGMAVPSMAGLRHDEKRRFELDHHEANDGRPHKMWRTSGYAW